AQPEHGRDQRRQSDQQQGLPFWWAEAGHAAAGRAGGCVPSRESTTAVRSHSPAGGVTPLPSWATCSRLVIVSCTPAAAAPSPDRPAPQNKSDSAILSRSPPNSANAGPTDCAAGPAFGLCSSLYTVLVRGDHHRPPSLTSSSSTSA